MSSISNAGNSAEGAQPATRSSSTRSRPTWLIATASGLLIALVVGIFAAAFVWPFKASDPHDIPFGVAGPDAQLEQIEAQLTETQPDLFAITTFEDREAVVAAIETRDVTGGLVVSDTGVEMLTASAGNVQISQMLTQMATVMKRQQAAAAQEALTGAVAEAQAQGAPAEQILAIQQAAQEQAATMTVTVTDVVPGGEIPVAGNLVMLPALLGGMATAMLAVVFLKRPWDRIIAVISGTTLAGLSTAFVLGPWMGIVQADFWMFWLALTAAMAAISMTIVGLGTLFGRAGLGVGGMLMMLVGNPWGGAFVPSEFLGGFMGWLGPVMPNGKLIELVQNISYFPDASQASQWWVFVIWASIGLALWATGSVIQEAKAKRHVEVRVA